MQLQDLVKTVVRVYAILCVVLGGLCLLLFIAVLAAEDLLKAYEGFLPELSVQLVIWGVLQLCLGIFLLIVADVLTRFIVRKLSGPSKDG